MTSSCINWELDSDSFVIPNLPIPILESSLSYNKFQSVGRKSLASQDKAPAGAITALVPGPFSEYYSRNFVLGFVSYCLSGSGSAGMIPTPALPLCHQTALHPISAIHGSYREKNRLIIPTRQPFSKVSPRNQECNPVQFRLVPRLFALP